MVPMVFPSGARQRDDAVPGLSATATCWIAQEFAAIQLNQVRWRRHSFTGIHARLADYIHQVVSQTHKSPSLLKSFAIDILTIGQARGILGYLFSIPGTNQGSWTNARLAESPHWQVLERYAPAVLSSLKELQGRPEWNSFLNDYGSFTHSVSFLYSVSFPATISDAWGLFDGWIGLAAQEREELITTQHNQAQAEALRLLAAAGFDPRSCASVFSSIADAQIDTALVQVYEQAKKEESW